MRCARAASARWCAIQRAKSSAGVAISCASRVLRRLRRVRQTLRHVSMRQLDLTQLTHPSPRGTPQTELKMPFWQPAASK
jgi:hypothetical protein